MVLKRVLGARADAEVMKNEIEKMMKDEDKEAFIMKNFVVNFIGVIFTGIYVMLLKIYIK
jgi:hypothetical protein